MKNKAMIMTAGFISLLLVTGCASVPEVQSEEDDVRQIPIEITSMKKDAVELTYVSVGEVVPKNQIDLYVSGGGFIESVNVKMGDVIEEGDLLIQLDDSVADRSNYNATESQLRTSRDNLKAQLDSANASLLLQETMFAQGLITKVELDQVVLQASTLQRQYSNAASAYRNQLNALEDSLDKSVQNRTIYSTVSGTVAAVYAKKGQPASNQIAISIVDNSDLYVKTQISSDLKKQLEIGRSVRVRLDGGEQDIEIGLIEEISALPDQQSKMFDALIHIKESEAYIIGDYAEVEFIIDRYEAVMIPTKSIVRSGLNQYIYTYDNEVVNKQLIITGKTKGEWIEIKDVDEISTVVVRGQNQLTINSEVVLVSAPDAGGKKTEEELSELK